MKSSRPVLTPAQRKQEICFELICNGRFRQAEIEVEKIKDARDPIVRLLKIWLQMIKFGSANGYVPLCRFMKDTKDYPDDWLLPRIMTSVLRTIDRMDVATDVLADCYNRFDKNFHGEAYFNYLIRVFQFENAQKVGIKLPPISRNRIRAAVSNFINACTNTDPAVRGKMLMISSAIVKKVLGNGDDHQKEIMHHIVSLIEQYQKEYPFRSRETRLVANPVLLTLEPVKKYPTAQEQFQITFGNPVKVEDVEKIKPYETYKQELQDAFAALRQTNRQWSDWEHAFDVAVAIHKQYPSRPSIAAVSTIINDISEYSHSHDTLPAFTAFFNIVKVLDVSLYFDKLEFVKKHVRNSGHKPHGIHDIIPALAHLSKNQIKDVLEYNAKFIELHLYAAATISQSGDVADFFSMAFIPQLKFDEMDEFERSLSQGSTYDDAYRGYCFRKVLEHMLEIQLKPLNEHTLEDIYDRISALHKIMFSLLTPVPLNIDLCVTMIVQFLRITGELYWYCFFVTDDDSHLETMASVLMYVRKNLLTLSPACDLMHMQVLRALGCSEMVASIYYNLELKQLQYESMGYMCSFYENSGRLERSIMMYESMDEKHHAFLHELDETVVSCYRFGFPELALSLVTQLNEHRNSIQAAIHYTRQRFYELIMKKSVDYNNLRVFILYDSFPSKLPFDRRDFQLHLLKMTVSNTAFALQAKSTTYGLDVAEILINKCLMEYIVLIGERRKGDEACQELEKFFSIFKSARNHFIDVANKNKYFFDETAIWAEKVIDPLIFIVNEFIKGGVTAFSLPKTSAAKILQSLPKLELVAAAYRRAENNVNEAIKGRGIGRHVQVLVAVAKIAAYFSQIVNVVYRGILAELGVSNTKTCGLSDYKSLSEYYRLLGCQYLLFVIKILKQVLVVKSRLPVIVLGTVFEMYDGCRQNFDIQREIDLKCSLRAIPRLLKDPNLINYGVHVPSFLDSFPIFKS